MPAVAALPCSLPCSIHARTLGHACCPRALPDHGATSALCREGRTHQQAAELYAGCGGLLLLLSQLVPHGLQGMHVGLARGELGRQLSQRTLDPAHVGWDEVARHAAFKHTVMCCVHKQGGRRGGAPATMGAAGGSSRWWRGSGCAGCLHACLEACSMGAASSGGPCLGADGQGRLEDRSKEEAQQRHIDVKAHICTPPLLLTHNTRVLSRAWQQRAALWPTCALSTSVLPRHLHTHLDSSSSAACRSAPARARSSLAMLSSCAQLGKYKYGWRSGQRREAAATYVEARQVHVDRQDGPG